MKNGFLNSVAEECLHRPGVDISSYCLVFPNRRSSVFFKKYFCQLAGREMFLPELVTVDDFFNSLSGLAPADRILSLYLLYNNYKAVSGTDESFDRFVGWGDVLLGDFDDVDKYMADADLVFSNIKDLKEMDSGYDFLTADQKSAIRTFWENFLDGYDEGAEESASAKKRFLRIWEVLGPLYKAFKGDLKGRGIGYGGMVYREVADGVLSGGEAVKEAMKDRKGVIFVGLNALNRCQEVLLDFLRDGGCPWLDVDFYWDFYGKKITDNANRSSFVMSRNVENYPSRLPLEPETLTSEAEPEYHLISVPSSVGQASQAHDILESLSAEGEVRENTAVVLADESLLDPVLNSIPESIRDINVTMGRTMKDSNVFSFMKALGALQTGKKVTDVGVSYSYRNVLSVLDNILFPDSGPVSSLKHSLVDNNTVYPSSDAVLAAFPDTDRSVAGELARLVFRPVLKSAEAGPYLTAVIESLEKTLSPSDREYAYLFFTAVTRLSSLGIEMEVRTFFKLLFALTSPISVSYRGEPLRGLQIMGPLETRALDFENVIILSVNEGVLPSADVSRSFIPYNIRKGYGLPTYELQDAVAAYNFYRVISRAKKVFFLYDSRTEGLRQGEPSRFLMQLKYHYKVKMEESVVTYGVSGSKRDDLPKEKDNAVMDKIRKKFLGTDGSGPRGSFSASSINQYLNCAMQFYYSQVEGLAPADDVKEDMDSPLFGTIFHGAARDVYSSLKNADGGMIDAAMLRGAEKGVKEAVTGAFAKDGRIPLIEGKNLIVERLLEDYLKMLLESDALRLERSGRHSFRFIDTEKQYKTEMDVEGGTVLMLGYIDRLDSFEDGVLRIVDYKTGKRDIRPVDADNVADLFDRSSESMGEPDYSLQLLLYVLLLTDFRRAVPEGFDAIRSCLVPLRLVPGSISGTDKAEVGVDADGPTLDGFVDSLKKTVGEILDPSVPFGKTTVLSRCEKCDFRVLCNR